MHIQGNSSRCVEIESSAGDKLENYMNKNYVTREWIIIIICVNNEYDSEWTRIAFNSIHNFLFVVGISAYYLIRNCVNRVHLSSMWIVSLIYGVYGARVGWQFLIGAEHNRKQQKEPNNLHTYIILWLPTNHLFPHGSNNTIEN